MPLFANGTFEVSLKPLGTAPGEGMIRMSIEKTLKGDLEATTRGEMLSAGDLKAGTAGYVAMELVTGSLNGRKGSFVLQHVAAMDASGPKMNVTVTPGSGTGELKGIAGVFNIAIADGAHSYAFEYTLPD